MARGSFDQQTVRSFLQKEKIATLEELKQALGSSGTMTVFRKLKALGYQTSYSHRGKYYTLTVPVARLGHLVALKLLSRDDRQRPQDLADLRMLLTRATPTDLTLAREALATITQRGFHRGRELLADLEALLS